MCVSESVMEEMVLKVVYLHQSWSFDGDLPLEWSWKTWSSPALLYPAEPKLLPEWRKPCVSGTAGGATFLICTTGLGGRLMPPTAIKKKPGQSNQHTNTSFFMSCPLLWNLQLLVLLLLLLLVSSMQPISNKTDNFMKDRNSSRVLIKINLIFDIFHHCFLLLKMVVNL